MQMALGALNLIFASTPPYKENGECTLTDKASKLCSETIEALEAELAKPDPEPVAWMMPDYGDVLSASEADGTGIYNIPLYTAPPKPEQKSISTNDHLCAMLRQVHDVLACTALPMKRKWQGLTDEEILSAAKEVPITCIRQRDYDLHFAPIIEAKLKEKNT